MRYFLIFLICFSISTTLFAFLPTPKIKIPEIKQEKTSEVKEKPASKKISKINDYGMTSSAHAKYAGQIVFSKGPIVFKEEEEKSFSSTFKYPKEQPYFMAYFPESIANRCLDEHGFLPGIADAQIVFSFYVNDKLVGSGAQSLSLAQLNEWTGWSDVDSPLGKEKSLRYPYSYIYKDDVIPAIKKGKNKIKMVVGYKVKNDGKEYSNKKPLSEGDFSLVSDADYKKVLQNPPSAVINDAKLEKQIKQALTAKWQKTTVIIKVILTEKQWRVEKDFAGNPVHKILRVYAITRPASGQYANTCFATPYEIKRNYIGNGKYSDKIVWHSSGGRPNYEVKCP